ncbi:MAG: hypothetical protein AB7D57_02225 [Desulfovibrionaceae bacterium]
MFGMFRVENPADRAGQMMGNASNSFAAMQRGGSSETKQNIPGPGFGGAVQAGFGGALAGAEVGTMFSEAAAAGPWGAGIGAGLAIGSYLFG